MECRKCGAKWDSVDADGLQTAKCPFCGAFLNHPADDIKIESMDDLLKIIVKNHGREILRNNNQTLALFAKYAPGLERERNLYSLFITCGGNLLLLDKDPAEDAAKIYHTICTKMETGWAVPQEIGLQICNNFWDAITGNDKASQYQEQKSEWKMIKSTTYNSRGDITSHSTFKYDANGRLLHEKYCEVNGTMQYVVHQYDSFGREVKAISYNKDGTVGFYCLTFEYDTDGNMVKQTSYRPESVSEGYMVFQYDAEGRISSASNYSSDGIKKREYQYKYNSSGKVIKNINLDKDGKIQMYTKNIYDAENRIIMATQYHSDGTLGRQFDYIYDKDGNRKKYINYNPDGTVALYITYMYDNNGNKIRETWYKANGEIEHSNNYEYVLQPVNQDSKTIICL